MADNVDIIRGGYDAFARRDAADLFSRFSPDIEWVAPVGSPRGLGGVYKGHEEVGGFFAKVAAAYGDTMAVVVDECVAADDRVIVFGRFEAHSTSGDAVSLGFVHSWTLADGVAVRMVENFDTAHWAELLAA
jgi:ketosteroid isomerase-like protein